ncbi:replication initiator protein A [Staphylococcus haemolyticus]|nr:replication initiator protein A [Staphylococcus haemolyticus]
MQNKWVDTDGNIYFITNISHHVKLVGKPL